MTNTQIIQSVLPTSKLGVGQKLNVGQILYSDNRQYYLILQQDGNLCIYNNDDNQIWCSKTSGKKSNFLTAQTDGNLVIYDNTNKALWATKTNGISGLIVSIDNDGVLRVRNNKNEIKWKSSDGNKQVNPINSEIKEAEFNYDTNSVQVYSTGTYGIAPWGTDNTYPDRTAQWIWYTQRSNVDSPTNKPVTIQYLYANTLHIQINGKLHIMIDNSCDVYLNKTKIASDIKGGWDGKWSQVNFTVLPGENLFEFMVKNNGGPGGLLVSGITLGNGPDNTNVLFHTDNTWKFIPLEPTPISTCSLSQSGLIVTTDKYFPWGCLNLNSVSSQYVSIGNTTTGMNGLSFGCWFKLNSNSNNTKLFDWGNGKEKDNIYMSINNTGLISLGVYLSSIKNVYDNINLIGSSSNVSLNQWNHIVWVISKPLSGISNWMIYFNGKMIWNKQMTCYPNNLERTNCWLGKSNWTTEPYFNGSISNFVMYQKDLSEKEVNALYNSLINLNDKSLYLYLPFSTNSVLDTMLNNYAGKIFTLPITQSKVKNENWNCMQEGKSWIGVKMISGKPNCMSMDGINCIEGTKEECDGRITNPVTPENPITCNVGMTNQKWCEEAKKILTLPTTSSSTSSTGSTSSNSVPITQIRAGIQALTALDVSSESESLNLKPLAGGGKVLAISKLLDVTNLMVGGVFKLRVNLPMMPPYIKGKNFDINTGTNPNYFYLSVEKLDNNCSVKANNGSCINVYADDKKCSSKALTSYTQNNSYRLVLVSSQYALDPSIPFGKNSDFTLVQVNGQTYLKNIQTNYLPSLYSNDSNILVHGDMLINSNTNVNRVQDLIVNTMCGNQNSSVPPIQTTGTKNIRCNIEQNPGIYLMTSTNIGSSSPVRININNDNSISLNLLSFNKYGYPTKNYALTYCKFNVQTYSYIEKITNNLGTFLVNMVCFTDTQDSSNTSTSSTNVTNVSNQLKFVVELISFPPNFIKENSVFVVE